MDTFLGLTVENWTQIGISILVILVGFLIIAPLVKRLARWLVRRTGSKNDDRIIEAINTQLGWLVGILISQIFILRLAFLPSGTHQGVKDFFFILYMGVLFLAGWKVVDLLVDQYYEKSRPSGEQTMIDKMKPFIKRLSHLLLGALVFTILLSHFKINISAFLTALGIGGLALSLAAQDILADLISGVIIYFDQPFRIGDRIDIVEIKTGGDVIDIGVRTTRIRSADNRFLIVPNSIVAKSHVINYSYPDPNLRVQKSITLGNSTDIDVARRIIIEAVERIEGVMSDKPVEVFFSQLGASGMVVDVGWWIATYTDSAKIIDKVNSTLTAVLQQSGFELPFTTYDVNLKVGVEDANRIFHAFKGVQ